MSQSAVPYPIVAALRAAETILGPDRQWEPANEAQARFCAEWLDPGRQSAAQVPEIISRASWSADDLNRFLRERGFRIQLSPFTPPRFGVVSILDLLITWRYPGQSDTVRALNGTRYPAVRLDEGVTFHRAAGHARPVAAVAAANGDVAYLTILDEEPSRLDLGAGAQSPWRPEARRPAQEPSGFDLVARAQTIEQCLAPSTREFGGLVFPKVALDALVPLEWLIGLRTQTARGEAVEVGQALRQTKLRMNEMGARVESAAATVLRPVMFRLAPPDLVIDRPFLLWFRRPGLRLPLAVFHLTEEAWRDPGTLK